MKITEPQAFPSTINHEHPDVSGYESLLGMSLRDYFAAKAMQGCIAKGAPLVFQDIASKAYEMADSMLLERSKNDK